MDEGFNSLEEIDKALEKARKDENMAITLANIAHKMVIVLEATRAFWVQEHEEE